MQSLSRFLNKIRYLLQETFLGLRRGGLAELGRCEHPAGVAVLGGDRR